MYPQSNAVTISRHQFHTFLAIIVLTSRPHPNQLFVLFVFSFCGFRDVALFGILLEPIMDLVLTLQDLCVLIRCPASPNMLFDTHEVSIFVYWLAQQRSTRVFVQFGKFPGSPIQNSWWSGAGGGVGMLRGVGDSLTWKIKQF